MKQVLQMLRLPRMVRLPAALALLVMIACPAFSGQVRAVQNGAGQARPNQPPRPGRPRAQAAISDVVQGLFIAQFQEQVEVSDDQYVRIIPLLRRGIETMRMNADRSLRANNLLRQLLQRRASEEELTAQVREVDEANRQTQAAQQTFLAAVDPFLTSEQKARFRIFQATFDQRLRELVQRARQLNNEPPQ